jgi:drug/metabolite transporter (DMT)-like permease
VSDRRRALLPYVALAGLALIWGVLLLHEAISLPIVVGMVVILVGIVVTNLRRPVHIPAAEHDSAAA